MAAAEDQQQQQQISSNPQSSRPSQDPDSRPFFRHSYLEDQPRRPLDAQRWNNITGSSAVATSSRTLGESGTQQSANSGQPVRRASVFKEQLSSAGHSRDNSDGQRLDTNGAGQGNSVLEQTEQGDLTELAAPAPIGDSRTPRAQQADLESAEEKQRKSKPPTDATLRTNWLTQIYIMGNLIFFSILGVLARQGTEWLTFYPGAPVVISNLWANFGGTLFMGFLSEDRQLFRQEWGDLPLDKLRRKNSAEFRAAHTKVKKTLPLFIGLTVGFCGSYTSFSTFMRDVFLAISNNVPTPLDHPGTPPNVNTTVSRSGGYSFEAAIAIVILTVTVNISGLYFGAHCALALDRWMPTLPFLLVRSFLDPLILFLGVGCWVGAVAMAALPPDRPGGTLGGTWNDETWRGDVVFALVFAPVGCIIRFLLSVQLNALVASFPLGTFAANMFGTAVLGMCYDLQHVSFGHNALVGGGRVSCQVLQGMQDGFCGALTTVSTWANELRSLENKHAYWYGAVSVILGFALLVIIMGSVRWTIGFGELACNVLVT